MAKTYGLNDKITKYELGDVITMKNMSTQVESKYKIGSVLGKWSIALRLPNVGNVGLYKVDEKECEGEYIG